MPNPTGLRPYSAGHFEILLDGHKTSSALKSVDGGWMKMQLIDEPTGSELNHVKHGGILDIDPVTIDFNMAGAYEILKWIQSSWRKEWSRRNGEIIHADFNKKQTFSQEFSDALITETTFPTLDGQSKEVPNMKVKFQPEKVVLTKKEGAQIKSNQGVKQKTWLASSFRLSIEGISNLDKVNKIEAFTIKQGVKKLYVGQDRFPTVEPTKIEYPNLVCTIAEAYGADLLKWHQDVMNGKKEAEGQLTGSLEFLNAAKESLFRLNLYEVGILSFSIVQATANEDKIKRVKFELFIGRMDLDGEKGLGLE
ncbi:MAG: phage tail protein [Kofleriaceae bacterium]